VAAILIIGAADGLSNLRRLAPAPVRRLLVIGVAGVVLVLNVAYQGGAKRLGDSPRRVRAGPCELRVQT